MCDNLSIAYIAWKKKGLFLPWNTLMSMSGITAWGSDFTSYRRMSELTGWAETLQRRFIVCVFTLWPLPLCPLPCYVNSSKICSHKNHNPLGYAAGDSDDFIICSPPPSLQPASWEVMQSHSGEKMSVERRAGGVEGKGSMNETERSRREGWVKVKDE